MNEQVRSLWWDFLDKKFSDLSPWIEDFDENVLVGRGPEYTIDEADIDEMANDLESIYSSMVDHGII